MEKYYEGIIEKFSETSEVRITLLRKIKKVINNAKQCKKHREAITEKDT